MTPALELQACLNTAWQATPDMALRSAIAAGLLVLGGWAGGRRRFPGQRSFIAVALLMAAWILLSVVEHAAVDAGCKSSLALLAWGVIMAQPPTYALFMYQYVNSGWRPRSTLALALMALPNVLLALLAWGNGWHGLLYGPGTRLGPVLAGLPRMSYDRGPLFHAAVALNYLWLALAATLVLRGLRRARRGQRGPWIAFLVMTLVPVAANLAYIGLGLRLLGTDPTSTAFGVTIACFGWLIGRNQMFSVVPLARRMLFSELPDPVLVLDQGQRVVEANRAALRLEAAEPMLDRPLADWPRVGKALSAHLAARPLPAQLELADPPAWYEVQVRQLGGPAASIGALVQLHDVSARHQAHAETRRHLAAREQELDQATAAQARLREQVLRDPLTGLLNRRALDDEQARTSGADAPALTLVLMDVDHFKRVNDTHGHAIGDAVLRDFAAALRSGLRADDALYRLGGEEFVLLMRGVGSEPAARRVDALRQDVATRSLGGLAERVTFSAGVASAGAGAADLDELMQRADRALYQAKRDGRNRTVRDAAG
jgi:diguanylate cyclase (GGDEF)-like protein